MVAGRYLNNVRAGGIDLIFTLSYRLGRYGDMAADYSIFILLYQVVVWVSFEGEVGLRWWHL